MGLCIYESIQSAGKWYEEAPNELNAPISPNFFEEPPPPNYGKYKGDESV